QRSAEGRQSAAEHQSPRERDPAGRRQPLEELLAAQDNPDMDLATLSQPVSAQLKPWPTPSGASTYSGQKNRPFIRLQRLGIVSAYNNTWMLNHETFSGLQPSTLNSTAFTYGSSAGINAGFLIGGKHRISAEMYVNSSSGQ